MTRRIGRRESDASPTNRLENGCPARIPAISRMVVPELPASSGSGRRTETSDPSSHYSNGGGWAVRQLFDVDAEPLQAGQRRAAVGARREIRQLGPAVGEGGQQA